jgi:RimJ/RimL family protein N-acetyltransferase
MSGLLDAVGWPVHSARLVLRPATRDDAGPAWRYRRLDAVSRWITRAPRTEADFRAQFGTAESLARTIVVELDATIVGDLMLKVEDAWAQAEVAEQARGVQAELGWVLDPQYAGRGYATEAVRELIRLCFEEIGLRRVFAGCFADNEASWRLMERVGMRREAYSVGDALHRSGRWLDGVNYALLATEWTPLR